MNPTKKIAYLVNQYPKVSHSFIRREILGLELLGFSVLRLSVRGWNDELVDPVDILERGKTTYILQAGFIKLLLSSLMVLIQSPLRWIKTLNAAIKMSKGSDKSVFLHLVYFVESCSILAILKKHKIDHLHVHFGTNPAEVAMLTRLLGGPTYSFTVHGPEEFDKPLALKLSEKIKYSAFVVAISSFGKSQLCRWIPYSEWPKVHVVHCGLDASFYGVKDAPIPSLNRIVCVGRLCEQKGQLLLVDAVAKLIKAGISIELVLGGDGEMRSQIEDRIRAHGINKNVRITGWISSEQVRDEIQQAKCLVLPSFAEGLPVVIMESMALKRPVLTTYIAGIPELVQDQKHGFLFPAGDVDALCESIKKLVDLNVDQLHAMGDAAYTQVLKRHRIESEVEKLAFLIEHH